MKAKKDIKNFFTPYLNQHQPSFHGKDLLGRERMYITAHYKIVQMKVLFLPTTTQHLPVAGVNSLNASFIVISTYFSADSFS